MMMTLFVICLAMLVIVLLAAYWFGVTAQVAVAASVIAAIVRLYMKFIAVCWLLLTARR